MLLPPVLAATPPPPLAEAPSPLRTGLGVWLTTVDSQVMFQPAEAQAALEFLQANGFRRAALPLYTGGYVYWPVPAERNPLGLPLDPRLPSPTSVPDLLDALGRRGLDRVGWLEFGLMAPAEAAWLEGRRELLLQDASGSVLWQESPGLKRVWLNPARPEVRAALVNLVVDACRRLPLEAIQLDDHLGYPARFGYDPTTLALWRQTAYGTEHPTPPADDPTWIAWRADRVTDLLAEIRTAMRAQCPAVRLSVAPNPQDFSYSSYLADWGRWVSRGLVDEVVVQIYRTDPARVAWELAQPGIAEARRRVPLRVGLLAGLKNRPKPPPTLQQEQELVRSLGIAGIDLFFYESTRPHFAATPIPAGSGRVLGNQAL